MSKYKKIILVLSVLAIVIGVTGLGIMQYQKANGKIDDWKFSNKDTGEGFFSSVINSFGSTMTNDAVNMAPESAAVGGNIGFSTGGAKDINNFRENIENGYFPISTDITYNGLFYDYTFDTGRKNESTELFSPSYSTAISKDPISNSGEYYMTVGLNSNIKQSDFARKKLNLTVVLDISGSMRSSFNSYYYDNIGQEDDKDAGKSKMSIALESVNILIDQLKDDDRFGMVLFDDEAYLGKEMSLVGETDMEAIKGHILEIEAAGGTNFESGYLKATELYEEYKNIDSNEYENRIIVITDAMPNIGVTSGQTLLSYVAENANNGIYTTFIGVGVDFNTKLTEEISDVRGANYYSVHSSSEFKERMGEQFEYMVTPLVFDLELNLESEDYEIAAVYGSDTINKETGNIMKVNTLFPSKTTSTGEVKGGVILLKLNKVTEDTSGELELKVSYKDRNGVQYSNSQTVIFDATEEHYENSGIRKAILLTRYANLMKNWVLYERSNEPRFVIVPVSGITDCDLSEEEVFILLREPERRSVALSVSDEYKDLFAKFKAHMLSEKELIGDETLNKEIELLDSLVK